MCSRLFLSFVPSVTPPASISRLFFPIVFFIFIYLSHPLHHVPSLLLHPLRFLCASFFFSLSLSFTLILPSYSVVLSTPISSSLLHPSYSPCRACLLLSLSNPPDTGQAGHVNTSSANRTPGDVIRVGSLARFGKEVAGVRVHL